MQGADHLVVRLLRTPPTTRGVVVVHFSPSMPRLVEHASVRGTPASNLPTRYSPPLPAHPEVCPRNLAPSEDRRTANGEAVDVSIGSRTPNTSTRGCTRNGANGVAATSPSTQMWSRDRHSPRFSPPVVVWHMSRCSTPARSVDTKSKPQTRAAVHFLSPGSGHRASACTAGGRRDAGCRVLRSLWSPGSQRPVTQARSELSDESDRGDRSPP